MKEETKQKNREIEEERAHRGDGKYNRLKTDEEKKADKAPLAEEEKVPQGKARRREAA